MTSRVTPNIVPTWWYALRSRFYMATCLSIGCSDGSVPPPRAGRLRGRTETEATEQVALLGRHCVEAAMDKGHYTVALAEELFRVVLFPAINVARYTWVSCRRCERTRRHHEAPTAV